MHYLDIFFWDDGEPCRENVANSWDSRPWRAAMMRLPEGVRGIWRLRFAVLATQYEDEGVPHPISESMAWKHVQQEIAAGKFPEEDGLIREPTPETTVEPETPAVAPGSKKGRQRDKGEWGLFS